MKTSELFLAFGTDNGGMQIIIKGTDHESKPKKTKWTLYAANGVGPYIPIISTIIITKKILSGDLNGNIKITSASACLGYYTLEEFAPYAKKLGIYFKEQIDG